MDRWSGFCADFSLRGVSAERGGRWRFVEEISPTSSPGGFFTISEACYIFLTAASAQERLMPGNTELVASRGGKWTNLSVPRSSGQLGLSGTGRVASR